MSLRVFEKDRHVRLALNKADVLTSDRIVGEKAYFKVKRTSCATLMTDKVLTFSSEEKEEDARHKAASVATFEERRAESVSSPYRNRKRRSGTIYGKIVA